MGTQMVGVSRLSCGVSRLSCGGIQIRGMDRLLGSK